MLLLCTSLLGNKLKYQNPPLFLCRYPCLRYITWSICTIFFCIFHTITGLTVANITLEIIYVFFLTMPPIGWCVTNWFACFIFRKTPGSKPLAPYQTILQGQLPFLVSGNLSSIYLSFLFLNSLGFLFLLFFIVCKYRGYHLESDSQIPQLWSNNYHLLILFYIIGGGIH